MKTLTTQQQQAAGEAWATELKLSPLEGNQDQYILTTGSKTALGVFKTITRRVEEAHGVTLYRAAILEDAYIKLWAATENGMDNEQFFALRETYRGLMK